jgi:VanZ family protein
MVSRASLHRLAAVRPVVIDEFTADTAVAARRLQRLSLVPFVDYYRGTEYHGFDQFVCKILLFFPLGALVASAHPWGDRGRAGFLVMLTAFGLAMELEVGQLFLATRHPSVTDVLIEVIGAWLGCDLTGRFRCALQVAATRDQEMP